MASAISFPVRSPQWVLTYQGVHITADTAAMVESISYTDRLSDFSGEIELIVEDHTRKWQSSWYPGLGDQISLSIGYRNEGLLPCGDFQIDQLELAGPPDTFTIRCLAASITPAMRTRNSLGYENQTLLGVVRTIAGKYGLIVISAPDDIDLLFERVTQKYESDLSFLKRLALEHGFEFTIRGSNLVFYSRATLEGVTAVQTVSREDLERYTFRNRTHSTYSGAQLTHHDPKTKSLIAQSVVTTVPTVTSDILKLVTRCENGQQATVKAAAALGTHNMSVTEASLVMPGSIAMAAGNPIELSGFGEFDGKYLTTMAQHRIQRSRGYTTHLEVSRVF